MDFVSLILCLSYYYLYLYYLDYYYFHFGGKEPKVRLKIDDNKTITCNASIDITKELGKKLYSYVGISGIAKYHPVDLEIIEFKIEEVLPFEDNRIAKGFKDLSEKFGCYFKDVDPEKFVKEIRG